MAASCTMRDSEQKAVFAYWCEGADVTAQTRLVLVAHVDGGGGIVPYHNNRKARGDTVGLLQASRLSLDTLSGEIGDHFSINANAHTDPFSADLADRVLLGRLMLVENVVNLLGLIE